MKRTILLAVFALIIACGETSEGGGRTGSGGNGGTGGSPPPPLAVDQTCRDWCANEPGGFSCHEGPSESVRECYEECLSDYGAEEEHMCGDEWISIKDCQVDLECEDLFGDCDEAQNVYDECLVDYAKRQSCEAFSQQCGEVSTDECLTNLADGECGPLWELYTRCMTNNDCGSSVPTCNPERSDWRDCVCQGGECPLTSLVFPCTEQGIRDAIREGTGPHTFDCDGPTTVKIGGVIPIDNDVILDGGGKLTVDGDGAHRVFDVRRATAELRGFIVTGGNEGGIYNDVFGTVTIVDCEISGNSSSFGGGILNQGSMTILNSRVSNNTSSSQGAGIASPHGVLSLTNTIVSGNTTDATGGGIFLGAGEAPELVLTNSTVSGNVAWAGGGIEINSNNAKVTIRSSTISGNQANALNGGGIRVSLRAELEITDSTLSENVATRDGASAVDAFNGATAIIRNTTVSGNVGGDGAIVATDTGTAVLESSLIDGACAGAVTSNGYNVESPGDTCGFDQGSDLVKIADPMIGPLRDNGGSTETHALLPGSVAVNRIPAATCQSDTDQRGEPRPETGGTMCDVGAFEVQP